MRETQKTLSVFFIITGVLGLLLNLVQILQLSDLAKEAGGLSDVAQAYRVLEYFFMCVAALLLVVGISYSRIVKSFPYLVPAVLVVVIVLHILVAVMVPQTTGRAIGVVLLLSYLFFQSQRITREILSKG